MIKPSGNPQGRIVVVGDAPERDEVFTETAFAGRLGDRVREELGETGFHLDEVAFINGISFPKEYQKLTPAQIQGDAKENLIPFLQETKRDLVIALGNNALCAVGVTDKPEKINKYRGHRLFSELIPNVPVVPSIHPFFIVKEPDEVDDFRVDLRYARRVAEGSFEPQAPINIIDLYTPQQVLDLLERAKYTGELAYDIETTGRDRLTASVVSIAFADGTKTDGKWNTWFWGGFDLLQPRYDPETMSQFWDAFEELFSQAGKSYILIGHNSIAFDDWVVNFELQRFVPRHKTSFESQVDTMLMHYGIRTKRPHGLKELTETYLGYPDYEAPVKEEIDKIVARRGKVLTEQIDFDVLKWEGVEPTWTEPKKGEPKPKWNKFADKKAYAYALIPFEFIRTYNSYDSLYTWMIFDDFSDRIEKENLGVAVNLRHKAARELAKAEIRGMLLDMDQNRFMHNKLEEIEKQCETKIQNEVHKLYPEWSDFNSRSNPDLGKLLFGEPIKVPSIDRYPLYITYDKRSVDKKVEQLEAEFYGDYTDLIKAFKDGGYEYEVVEQALLGKFKKQFKIEGRTTPKPLYANGLYIPDPKAFTKTGQPSVGSAILTALYEQKENPILALLLMKRKAEKLRSTFVDAIYKFSYKDYILRSRFNAVGTEQGRISSSAPNSQNFPPYMRGQLIARPGYVFVNGDLSAAEVRVMAILSGDEALIEAVYSTDIHSVTASKMFGIPIEQVDKHTHRHAAKTILFGLVYGMSAFRLAVAIGVSVERAEELIQDLFRAYPKLKEWLDNQVAIASEFPYYVYTPWGTRRSTKNILSPDLKISSHTERIAKNMPVQGAAGELTLYYIIEIMAKVRERNWDVWFVQTTHDSMTYETPEHLADDMVQLILDVVATPVPISPLDQMKFKIDVDVDKKWYGEPDLLKAIDPNFEKDKQNFRWDLLDFNMSDEERDELNELEEAYYARLIK